MFARAACLLVLGSSAASARREGIGYLSASSLFGIVAVGQTRSLFQDRMSAYRDGSTIVIKPGGQSEGDADSLVVIMHGLGDTSDGFADVAAMFSKQMPRTKFVLPTAPTQPVTLNGGYAMPSWYDIEGLADRATEKCAGIQQSAARIQSILENEHTSNGIPYSRMVLAGFSQGGALSLYTGMQLPLEKKLAGILVMSGYLAGATEFKLTPGLESTPVLHQHGTADPMVKYSWAEQTRDSLVGMGATNYELKPYEGLVHSVSIEELNHGLEFLQRVLPRSEKANTELEPENMSIGELKEAIRRAGLGDKAVGLLQKQELVNLLKKGNGKDEI